MSRLIHAGDQSFDWTIWYVAAKQLRLEGKLTDIYEHHKPYVYGLEKGQRHPDRKAMDDHESASAAAEDYALGVAKFGWCLRDAGFAAAIDQRARVYEDVLRQLKIIRKMWTINEIERAINDRIKG